MKDNAVYAGVIIFAVALAVRLVLLLCDDGSLPQQGDTHQYLAIAQSLRQGNGYSLDGSEPTASRMPLYPLFLSSVLSLPGSSVRTVQILQILIDSVTCILIFLLARAALDRRTGIVSGMIAALYVPLAARSLTVMTETLFAFFLAASVLIALGGRSRNKIYVAAGLLMGLGSLVRPNGLIVSFFIVLWFWYRSEWRKALHRSVFFMLGITVVLAPWVVRNAIVFHRFIPTCTISGITLYNSYFIPEKGLSYNEIKPEHREYYSYDNEADRSGYLTRLTACHIINNPLQALKLIPVKLALLVYPYDMRWLLPGFPFRYNIFWGVIAMFALPGVSDKRFRCGDKGSIILWVLSSLIATTVIFYGSSRMRAPFDLFVIVTAATGVLLIGQYRHRWIVTAGIVVVNSMLLLLGESSFVICLIRSFSP